MIRWPYRLDDSDEQFDAQEHGLAITLALGLTALGGWALVLTVWRWLG